jgi:UDP:flavonoid glycosyltransferase YjiC (YdhE family)
MRVLFSCTAGEGHFTPLVPLACAFRDRGDKVAFATARSRAEGVVERGFEWLEAGLSLDEVQALHAPARERLQLLPPSERRPFAFTWRFVDIDAPAKVAQLYDVARAWQPDLVVHEAADVAAPPVAEALGVPSANHSFGRGIPRACLEQGSEGAAAVWRAIGVEPQPLCGMYRGAYIDICPPSFRGESAPEGTAVHPLRPAASTLAPDGDGDLPVVYVTLGTVFNELSLLRLLLDALASVECKIVMTIGRNRDPEELAPWPANARVERYIPQAEILPSCAVVVAHGGSGSTLGALAHGVPMLIVPRGADQFENADACREIGAALVLMPDAVSVDAARRDVELLLADSHYRDRARAVAAEIDAMPSAADVAAALS